MNSKVSCNSISFSKAMKKCLVLCTHCFQSLLWSTWKTTAVKLCINTQLFDLLYAGVIDYTLHPLLACFLFLFSFSFLFHIIIANKPRCCKISSKYIQISLRFTYSIPEYSMIADFIVVKYTISEEIWKKKVAFCCNLKLKELFSYRLCSNLNFQVTL